MTDREAGTPGGRRACRAGWAAARTPGGGRGSRACAGVGAAGALQPEDTRARRAGRGRAGGWCIWAVHLGGALQHRSTPGASPRGRGYGAGLRGGGAQRVVGLRGGAPRESRMCRFHGAWRSARVSRHHRVSVEGGLCRRPAEPRRALEPWARAQLASAAVPSPRGRVPAAPSLRVCVVRAHGPSSDGLPGGPGQP